MPKPYTFTVNGYKLEVENIDERMYYQSCEDLKKIYPHLSFEEIHHIYLCGLQISRSNFTNRFFECIKKLKLDDQTVQEIVNMFKTEIVKDYKDRIDKKIIDILYVAKIK